MKSNEKIKEQMGMGYNENQTQTLGKTRIRSKYLFHTGT